MTSLQNDHLKSIGNLSSRSLKTSNDPTKLDDFKDSLGETNILDNKKLASTLSSESSDSLLKHFSDSDEFKKKVKASSPSKEVKLTKKISSRSSSSSQEKIKTDKKTPLVSSQKEIVSETRVAEKENDYEDDFDADNKSSSSSSSSI